jgi:hypothetical protein
MIRSVYIVAVSSQNVLLKADVLLQSKQHVFGYKNIDYGNVVNIKTKYVVEPFWGWGGETGLSV